MLYSSASIPAAATASIPPHTDATRRTGGMRWLAAVARPLFSFKACGDAAAPPPPPPLPLPPMLVVLSDVKERRWRRRWVMGAENAVRMKDAGGSGCA